MATFHANAPQTRAIALVMLIGVAGQASAGTIVQTTSYSYAGPIVSVGFYQPFDSSLGILTEVDIAVSGFRDIGGIQFENNDSPPTTISYNGFFTATRNTDAGPSNLGDSFFDVLPPDGTTIKDLQGSYGSSAVFTDVGFWIGTPLSPPLAADELAVSSGPLVTNFQVGADDPRITVVIDNSTFSDSGTETITYVYQEFSSVPEPASLAMSVIAALALAMVRCTMRKTTPDIRAATRRTIALGTICRREK